MQAHPSPRASPGSRACWDYTGISTEQPTGNGEGIKPARSTGTENVGQHPPCRQEMELRWVPALCGDREREGGHPLAPPQQQRGKDLRGFLVLGKI